MIAIANSEYFSYVEMTKGARVCSMFYERSGSLTFLLTLSSCGSKVRIFLLRRNDIKGKRSVIGKGNVREESLVKISQWV